MGCRKVVLWTVAVVSLCMTRLATQAAYAFDSCQQVMMLCGCAVLRRMLDLYVVCRACVMDVHQACIAAQRTVQALQG